MVTAALAFIVLAQEEAPDVAEEGRRIIIAMLLVALTFLLVILLGQLGRYLGARRRARKAARRPY